MVAQRAGKQAEADDAVADDHHGREYRVAGQRILAGAAEELERNDQRHFDDRDGEREDQRAEGLADTVGHRFRVLHGHHHAGDQGDGDGDRDQPAERPAPDRAQQRAGGKRPGNGP